MEKKQKIFFYVLAGFVALLAGSTKARNAVKDKILDIMNFEFLLPFALKWECNWTISGNTPYFFTLTGGAYTDNKNDKGGETKWGITKKYYPNLDIKNLTFSQAKEIYKTDYWERYKVARAPVHLRIIFFDAVINHGGGWATRELQKLAGVKQDSIFGAMTEAAAMRVSVTDFAEARRKKYHTRVKEDATQLEFLKGWLNRVNDVEAMQIKLNQTYV